MENKRSSKTNNGNERVSVGNNLHKETNKFLAIHNIFLEFLGFPRDARARRARSGCTKHEAAPSDEGPSREADPCFDPELSTACGRSEGSYKEFLEVCYEFI